MAEDLLINHKRFKTAHKITATKYQKYNSFFNDYAKRNNYGETPLHLCE